MSNFLTPLRYEDKTDKVHILIEDLTYQSDLLGEITIAKGFETDGASVPRIPIFYELFGDRAHYEGVVHDWLYRYDSIPLVSFGMANKVFLEAMICRDKSWWIKYPMYWGVCTARLAYHKRSVNDKL